MASPAFPWKRFRRMVGWMALGSLAIVALTLGMFYREFGMVSIHFYIATGLGVGCAVMLMAVLMALAFVSNSSGHDAAASDHGVGGSGGGESR